MATKNADLRSEVTDRAKLILEALERTPHHNPATRNPFRTAQAVARRLNKKGRGKPEVFNMAENGRFFTSYDVKRLGVVAWSPADKAKAQDGGESW